MSAFTRLEFEQRIDDVPRLPEAVTSAQSVVRSIEKLGVDCVFCIPGGAVLPVYDPLLGSTNIRHVLVRHEQPRDSARGRTDGLRPRRSNHRSGFPPVIF